MLVPAGFIIIIILAALSVDTAIAYLGQRELFDMAAAAAGDAAVLSLDEPEYYTSGLLELDEDRARAAVDQTLQRRTAAGQDLVTLATTPPEVTVEQDPVSGEWRVSVAVEGSVDLLFSPATSGAGTREVRGIATVAARQALSDGLPPPPPLGPPPPGPGEPGGPPPAEAPGSADLPPPQFPETATPTVPPIAPVPVPVPGGPVLPP